MEKKEVQKHFTFRAYPSDIDELQEIKNKSELTWPSLIRLLIAEHKDVQERK